MHHSQLRAREVVNRWQHRSEAEEFRSTRFESAQLTGGVADLMHHAAQGEGRRQTERWQRKDAAAQQDEERDRDRVLGEVRERAVRAIV